MEALLSWLLRVVFLLVGLGAGLWILRWLLAAWRNAEERWPLRVAIGMLLLAVVYAVGHARMLVGADKIEEGRRQYVQHGDPRRTEQRRAEVRGWIHDCTSRPDRALALYRARNGVVERTYPIGAAVANFVGGGPDADERDYTIERLFSDELRKPVSLMESGELHAAGTDLHLTLCSDATAQAWQLLRQTGRPGAVIVQDVQTGALVAYASNERPNRPPLGLQEYAAPGSVWKLAVAALWWEHGLPETPMSCEAAIQVTPRSVIRNSEGFSIPRVSVPTEMLVYSCNTTAVQMALDLRERLGEEAFQEAYRRFGFIPYTDDPPRGFQRDFWRTESDQWSRRMSPPAARVRLGPSTSRQEWAQLAIGQGPIDATVMHVSRFLQGIGNGGVMLRPTIEQEVVKRGTDDEADQGERIMSQETAQKLMVAMLGVVDQGTARSTQPILQGLTWDLAGKTGTAQIAGTEEDNGWFAGLIIGPDRRPRYTVVVFLAGGGPGGRMPAAIGAGMTRFFATRQPARAAARED